MSIEEIRKLYLPKEHYHISQYKYNPGDSFDFISRAVRMHIIEGSCKITEMKTRAVTNVSAPEVVDMPAGRFEFEVTSSTPVEYIGVFTLPEEYRKKK